MRKWMGLCVLCLQLIPAVFPSVEASLRRGSHYPGAKSFVHEYAKKSLTASVLSDKKTSSYLDPLGETKEHRRPLAISPCTSAIFKRFSMQKVPNEQHERHGAPAATTAMKPSLPSSSSSPLLPRLLQDEAAGENDERNPTAIDRVYILHYTKTQSRLATSIARLAKHGLAEHAVAVMSLDKEELDQETVDCFFAKDDSWPPLRPGEQSVSLKFYGALYDMVNDVGKPISSVLFVEDDIWIDDASFDKDIADVMQALPRDYDVLHLGDCLGYKNMWRTNFVATGLAKPVSEYGSARIFRATNAPCAHAFLVSRAGALKLLQQALPMTRPLDQHIEYYTKNVTLLNAYYSERDLFWQESQEARSGKLAERTGIRDR